MVCLPNIIVGDYVVPEIIEHKVTPENIANHIEKLLYDKEVRQKQLDGLSGVRALLSEKVSSREAAQEIINEITSGN